LLCCLQQHLSWLSFAQNQIKKELSCEIF